MYLVVPCATRGNGKLIYGPRSSEPNLINGIFLATHLKYLPTYTLWVYNVSFHTSLSLCTYAVGAKSFTSSIGFNGY